VGLKTPGIPVWEITAPIQESLEFRTLSRGRKNGGILRTTEHVDLVIVAMHTWVVRRILKTGGIQSGTGANENEALAIAKTVTGIDVILGHTDKEFHR